MTIKEALEKEVKLLKKAEYKSYREAEDEGDSFIGSGYRVDLRLIYGSYSRILKDLDNDN